MLLVSMPLSFFYHSIMLIVWFIFSSGQNDSNTWYLRGLRGLLLNWPTANTSIWKCRTSSKSEPQPHGGYKENRFVVDFGLSCRRHKRTFVLRFSGNILSTPDRRAAVLRDTICIFHEQCERKSSFRGRILFFSRSFRCSNNIGPCWTLKRVNKEQGESQLHVSHPRLRRREGYWLCSAVRLPPPRWTLSSQTSTTTTPSLTSPYLLTSPSERKRPTFLWASSGWVWRLSRFLMSADTTVVAFRGRRRIPVAWVSSAPSSSQNFLINVD